MKTLIVSLLILALSVLGISYAAPVYSTSGYPRYQPSDISRWRGLKYVPGNHGTDNSLTLNAETQQLLSTLAVLAPILGTKALNYVANCVLDDCTAEEEIANDQEISATYTKLMDMLKVMKDLKEKIKEDKKFDMDDRNAQMQQLNAWMSNAIAKDAWKY